MGFDPVAGETERPTMLGGGSSPHQKSRELSHNWPLLVLIAMIPLQNIYLGKIPTLGAGINFINLMAVAAFIVWKRNRDRAIPSYTDLHYPIYWFVAIYIVSAIHGVVSMGYLPERYISSLKDLLLPMLIFFIVLNSIRDRRGIVAVVVATLLPMPYMFRVFYAQFSSLYSWHYSDNLRFVKGTFMMLGSNELAAFYAAYSFVVILLALYVKQLRYKLLLGVVAFLNLYSLMYSQSRGAWLAFLTALLIVLYKTGKVRVLLVVVVLSLSAPMVVKLFPVSVQERFDTIFVDKGEERDKSAESRFIIWENAWQQYKKSPLFGVGYRVFNQLNSYENKDTHNYYIKLLVENGPPGLLLFLLILWRAYRNSSDLWKRSSEPVFRALGLGMVAAVVCFSVANLFGDRFTHYPLSTYFWVYLALVLRARSILENEGTEAGNEPEERPVIRFGQMSY